MLPTPQRRLLYGIHGHPQPVQVSDGDTFVRREFRIYVVGDDYLKADNTLDWSDDYWDEGKEYSNNIVELFNLHPRVIVDLCYISDIGSTKLLKMIKLNQYMLKNSKQMCCYNNEHPCLQLNDNC